MRLNKSENGAMTLAVDTAITFMEFSEYTPAALPPSCKKTERDHALIMLRSLRSKLLRSAAEPANNSPTQE